MSLYLVALCRVGAMRNAVVIVSLREVACQDGKKLRKKGHLSQVLSTRTSRRVCCVVAELLQGESS